MPRNKNLLVAALALFAVHTSVFAEKSVGAIIFCSLASENVMKISVPGKSNSTPLAVFTLTTDDAEALKVGEVHELNTLHLWVCDGASGCMPADGSFKNSGMSTKLSGHISGELRIENRSPIKVDSVIEKVALCDKN